MCYRVLSCFDSGIGIIRRFARLGSATNYDEVAKVHFC